MQRLKTNEREKQRIKGRVLKEPTSGNKDYIPGAVKNREKEDDQKTKTTKNKETNKKKAQKTTKITKTKD